MLLVLAAAGTAVYLLAAMVLRSDELGQVRRYLLHRGAAKEAT